MSSGYWPANYWVGSSSGSGGTITPTLGDDPLSSFSARLLTSAAITSIVGVKIRPIAVLPEDVMPYITFQEVGGDFDNDAGGGTDVGASRVQVQCWATDYATCRALAKKVRQRLNGWSDPTAAVPITMCHLTEINDDPDPPQVGEAFPTYRVMLDFLLEYVDD